MQVRTTKASSSLPRPFPYILTLPPFAFLPRRQLTPAPALIPAFLRTSLRLASTHLCAVAESWVAALPYGGETKG